MHPKIERLAELADTAGVDADAELQAHVEACTSCQAQVSQLQRLAEIGCSRRVESLPERGGHVTDEEIIGYVNVALNPEKQAHIKRHLRACGRCMKEVLLYRSHLAQARLAQSPAAIAGHAPGAWPWLAKLSAWVRGLFYFSMPATLWVVMASIVAVVVGVNWSWLSELGAPTTSSTQALENTPAMPVAAHGNEAATVATVPENSLASGQTHDHAKLNLQSQEKRSCNTSVTMFSPSGPEICELK